MSLDNLALTHPDIRAGHRPPFVVVEHAVLDVVRHALTFAEGWRPCYTGCECDRCQLAISTRQLGALFCLNAPE